MPRFFALVFLLLTTLSCQGADSGEPQVGTISVSGEGLVMAVPDMVTVTVGVVTQAEDAARALSANNEAMASLANVLDKFDIAERDRRTSGFNISPRYERSRVDGRPPEITSYEVSNQLTIRNRDLDRTGKLLDAVVRSGSNRISGLSFGNQDEARFRDEARKLAVADATRRAALYAQAAGRKPGRILSIAETGAPQPRPMLRGAMMAEAVAVPIAAGENEFRATVNVVFELDWPARD